MRTTLPESAVNAAVRSSRPSTVRRSSIGHVRKIERDSIEEIEVRAMGRTHVAIAGENAQRLFQPRQEHDVVVSAERAVGSFDLSQSLAYLQIRIEIDRVGGMPDVEGRSR